MKITPLDIRHKEFARSVRGYKDTEVDEFLDEITAEFERLFNENIDSRERLEALEEKISQYRNIEDTLQKTLVSAQQQAEELKQNAQKEADLILRDAELKSRSIVNDSYAERQKVQRSVQALKQKHEDLRYQLRKIIDTYANILDQDIEAIEESIQMERAEPADVQAEAEETGVEEALSGKPLDPQAEVRSVPEAPVPGRHEQTLHLSGGESSVLGGEQEDPFADVEIDTDSDKFKW
ncbi:MAG: DivIVA domain-containing protein [Thermoleophilia bacterium]|nr:DivIVA domain-containing protein [Thermoleophilia bacterium]